MKDLLSTHGLKRSELEELIEEALRLKSGGRFTRNLEGRSVALVFLNPSLRTRTSMQVAIYELGGNPVVLEPGGNAWAVEYRDGVTMDGDKAEHLKEFIGVLEQYVSAIGVRCFAGMKDWGSDRIDPVLNAISKIATVPVINLESAMHHPCQSIADMMTIRERLGKGRKRVLLTWAWHPRSLPMAVPNSFALAAAQMGHDLRISHPQGYELDDELMNYLAGRAEAEGGSVEIVHECSPAYDGAEVVYAKSWGSREFYGDPEAEAGSKAKYRGEWIVDEERMTRTDDAIFMHCLPVRRNVVVTDAVIDSANSVVLEEAANRLHVAKAVLKDLEMR